MQEFFISGLSTPHQETMGQRGTPGFFIAHVSIKYRLLLAKGHFFVDKQYSHHLVKTNRRH
jgi:hypothetical protein